MKETTETSPFALLASDGAYDPLEDGVRQRVRHFVEELIEEELRAASGRGRYERSAAGATGHRNGRRAGRVVGTFGAETVKRAAGAARRRGRPDDGMAVAGAAP